METKLKPCPWCGKKPALNDASGEGRLWYVRCINNGCGCRPSTVFNFASDTEATAAWNNRKG